MVRDEIYGMWGALSRSGFGVDEIRSVEYRCLQCFKVNRTSAEEATVTQSLDIGGLRLGETSLTLPLFSVIFFICGLLMRLSPEAMSH